ncbi:MAG TPA: aminotransferase class V-fold PLP-dependent enzyme [Micromonosporaceae bacterium]|jgi:perosamine synthetase
MLPYGRQSISEDDIAAVVDVLRGDWLTIGPMVARFDEELSRWAGGAACASVTSGTAALHVAYAATNVGPGDEVIATPMTFVATAGTAILQGATVVFADVDADTALINPDAVRAAITDRTKVIAAVDFGGHPADHDTLAAIARDAGAYFLVDAAHAIGSRYKGRLVGSTSDITTYSFFPTKNMTTAEGGAVATTDPGLELAARRFKNHGLVRDKALQRYPDEGGWHQEVHRLGLNYRLPDVLCALGIAQLGRLDSFIQRRARLVARYNELLADVDGLALPPQSPDVEPAWHLYTARVLDGRRREVYEKMHAAGIGVQVNYMPVYWHPAFEDMGYRRGMCPNAETFYRQELSLPLFPDLTDSQQDQVVDALRGALG